MRIQLPLIALTIVLAISIVDIQPANGQVVQSGKVLEIQEKANPYIFPATDEGQPGEGPLRRKDYYVNKWNTVRAKWGGRVAEDTGGVVFFGDSISEGWGDNFKDQFKGLKAVNRGIGGDTTRGMLIRLNEDVLKLKPKSIVMLMGTNDLSDNIDLEAIGRNVKEILNQIHKAYPDIPVIFCNCFPSVEKLSRPAARIKKLNEIYAAAVKGNTQVTLIDTWTLFAGADEDSDPAFFKDRLHLNDAGYTKWAKALIPVLATHGFLETEEDNFKPEDGYTSLFNGKDLTGWRFLPTLNLPKTKPGGPVFPEVKEEIVFDGKTQSSDGRYRAVYGKIVVTTPAEGRRIQQLWTTQEFNKDFTLRLEFRATPNADSGVFIRKPQIQCRDYPLAGPYKNLKNYKMGDWNQLEFTVKDGKAHATCNGEVLEEALAVPATGPIGLEGDRGQMEYRRIRIKSVE